MDMDLPIEEVLDKGTISPLASDSGRFGWSGEVHLLVHANNKYVVRICQDVARAKQHETTSNKLERYGFLPALLGRVEDKIVYEYIEGRDLKKKESAEIFRQIGQLCAHCNQIPADADIDTRFNHALAEQSLLSPAEFLSAQKLYAHLNKQLQPATALDVTDINHENFRICDGKVYLVDIEAISPRIRLSGAGKAFLKWFTSPEEQESFKEGYGSIKELTFFTEEYQDFVYLNYLVQEAYLASLHGKEYKPRYPLRLQQLQDLLKKYNDRL
jgi:hypothetical protein